MNLIIKALIGAVAVLLIQFFAQSKNYYIAGLVPLFPTFAIISHYIVGTQRSASDLRETILFGIFALLPYFLYLISLYFLIERFNLIPSLIVATVVWLISALILISIWTKTGTTI